MIREAKKQYIIKLQNSLIDKSIPPGKWWRIEKLISIMEGQWSLQKFGST
jgi:hypothetical protein